MDFLLQNILPYLIAYKYLALFVISFLAAFVLPAPSGSLLTAAAALSLSGYFNIGLVIFISILGNILGDNSNYWLARLYGEKVFSFIGFRQIFKSKTFKLMEKNFREHPGFIVLASRFEVLSTLSVNLLAGVSRVPYKKYLFFESIGSTAQVCFYGLIGYLFGYNWQAASKVSSKISILIVFIWIFMIIVFWKKIISYLKKDKPLT
jgi:membrane-associated protein